MMSLVGYFTTVSMIMNVARTPPMSGKGGNLVELN